MTAIKSYTNHRKKWHDVVTFASLPRETPRTSKEGDTVARFKSEGDAWLYAQRLAKPENPIQFALIAIR